jgi:YD repeat-containing protein
MMKTVLWSLLAFLVSGLTQSRAAETVTYTYDAKGRLVKVVRTGTVNNNVETVYTYDKADNRKTQVTTGSQNPPQ